MKICNCNVAGVDAVGQCNRDIARNGCDIVIAADETARNAACPSSLAQTGDVAGIGTVLHRDGDGGTIITIDTNEATCLRSVDVAVVCTADKFNSSGLHRTDEPTDLVVVVIKSMVWF